jgi:hypothetical protein
MYPTVEMIPFIGLFGLLATAAGWGRQLYLAVREPDAARSDARARAATARQAFRASRQTVGAR